MSGLQVADPDLLRDATLSRKTPSLGSLGSGEMKGLHAKLSKALGQPMKMKGAVKAQPVGKVYARPMGKTMHINAGKP
jgi:hypothetical protein